MSFYSLLGIDSSASLPEIRKAYRQKSLLYHPDKQSSKTAKEQEVALKKFEEIKAIMETFMDPVKKAVYDQKVKGEELKRRREAEMDAVTARLKRELEEREKVVDKKQKTDNKLDLERIREEGRRLQEAKSELRNQSVINSIRVSMHLENYDQIVGNASVIDCSVKVKWDKSDKVDEISVKNYFSEFGRIDRIIMSKKSATIVFKSVESVYNVLHGNKAHGIFKVKLIGKTPDAFGYISLKRGDDVGIEIDDDIKLQSYNRGAEYEKLTLDRLAEQKRMREELLTENNVS